MTWNEILNIILVLVSVAATLLGYYFKIKAKLEKEVNGKINDAEQSGESGEKKMEHVVNDLYSIVPVPYRIIFTKEFIKKLVQAAFDKIEEYAKKQVNKNKE